MFDKILKKAKDAVFGTKPTVLKNILFNEKKTVDLNPRRITQTPTQKQDVISAPKIATKIPNKLATDIIQNKQVGVSRDVIGSPKKTTLGTRITPTAMPTRAVTPTPTIPTVTPPPDKSAVPYYKMINEAADKYKVPQKILYNLLRTESMGFNPRVISGEINSPVGAQGIAQFMPATAKGIGLNPLDPPAAIDASAKYLFRKYLEHGKDWRLALAAYNAGSGNVRKYGGVPPFPETQSYIKRILEEE